MSDTPPHPSLSTLKANAEKGMVCFYSQQSLYYEAVRAYLDALEREAGTCHKCGGPVFNRPNKPGEYDHDCKPIAELERGCQEPETFPIQLTQDQELEVKEWAKDDRLWTTQETIEFNLRVFARRIIQRNTTLTFSDALRIARGCLTAALNIGSLDRYGIQTVINALEAAEKEKKA